jgi:hypothetical protein
MGKKPASILLHCGIVGWLIAFFACNDRSELGGRIITQGLILSIIWFLFIPGYIVGLIFTIMAIVHIAKGAEDYKLPLFGEANWFKQY